MRWLNLIPAAILIGCASGPSEPLIHVWTLEKMQGLDSTVNVRILEGYQRVGSPEDYRKMKFWTVFDPERERFAGTMFEGCNGAKNFKADTYENGWAPRGPQVACTTLIQRISDPNSPIIETSEKINSLRQYAEERFLELAPEFKRHNVDWNAGELTYLDSAGQVLVGFRYQGLAE